MNLFNHNDIIVDINKVQSCSFFYVTSDGLFSRRKKPKSETWKGSTIKPEDIAYPYDDNFKFETVLERAKRYNLIDIWIPVCKVKVQCAGVLTYAGDKAESFFKAWRAHIFGKK